MSQINTPAAQLRRTIVVANPHALRWHRLQAARAGQQGTQVMMVEQLVARLAGGFVQAVDAESLQRALRECLPSVALGELEEIRNLPGAPSALLSTLGKCWSAGFDLQADAPRHGRIAALAAVDSGLRAALPSSMLSAPDLVRVATGRIRQAPIVLGDVDFVGMAELDPCWRPLVLAMAGVTRVRWLAGSNAVPAWLEGSVVQTEVGTPMQPQRRTVSAAHAAHEALEAMRWVRELLASGRATPGEIAIASVNTGDYDEALQALSRESGLDLHFAHGRPVAATRDGQSAAALADALLNGVTRRRLRRCAIELLPKRWERALPRNVTLRSAASWRKVLARLEPGDWPEDPDDVEHLRYVVELLLAGAAGAEEAGEQLLSGSALAIWRRALLAGPAHALLETLSRMRMDDGLDSCVTVGWMPAEMLATAPRRYVWLLGLNAGAWPRANKEDSLLPGHIVPARMLDPVPRGAADRQAFNAIAASCEQLVASFSRRDSTGRHGAASALLRGWEDPDYLQVHAPASHAVSEADRLLGRPAEFHDLGLAVSAIRAWRNWQSADITEHDGLFGPAHPALVALTSRVQSASSLKSMLRNPIAHMWEYGMRWQAPDAEEELLELEPLQFGKLVHAIVERALDQFEAAGSLGAASPAQLEAAMRASLDDVAARWPLEESVPPAALWQHTLRSAGRHALAALTHGQGAIAGARAFAEVPFGGAANGGKRSPWDNALPVKIPGTGLSIKGVIDRLDLSPDGKHAIVRDYKTGKNAIKAGAVLDGGRELQRSLYAFAARVLLEGLEKVQASLLYTRQMKEFVLDASDEALEQLAEALSAARESFVAGHAVPGPDASDEYDKFALLLPPGTRYWQRKEPAILALLGDAATIWEAK